MVRLVCVSFALLVAGGPGGASDLKTPDSDRKPVLVPFRLTQTQHVLIRVKLDGKGPFNFIIDTGAPISFVTEKVGKKLGLEKDDKGWTTVKRFEIEGGLSRENVKMRLDTPFQLEGMNGMGLAGSELHGILGYTELARYRMSFDFTKDKLRWTPLDFEPPAPVGIAGKGAQGLEWIGSLLKMLGALGGMKPPPPPVPRGFLGVELVEVDKGVQVQAVLAKGPASEAGLRIGDVLREIDGQEVRTIADVRRLTAKVLSGQTLRLLIRRGGQDMEITADAGDGL